MCQSAQCQAQSDNRHHKGRKVYPCRRASFALRLRQASITRRQMRDRILGLLDDLPEDDVARLTELVDLLIGLRVRLECLRSAPGRSAVHQVSEDQSSPSIRRARGYRS